MIKENKKENLFAKIRRVVSKIPRGKVLTYGQVAQMVGIKDARKVGWAVYGNQDEKVPCHRVVFADGYLATNYSLGGWQEQKKRLEMEGVKFIGEAKVDLEKSLASKL